MDGFRWTLVGGDGCLNLYFSSWRLDTRSRFVAAMAAVTVLGVLTEGIARLRHDVSKRHRRALAAAASQSSSSTAPAGPSSSARHGRRRAATRLWYLLTFLHGMNALGAYLLMLATMTYSLELLLCVIGGLVAGYWYFGGDSYTHAGSPCCAFLDDNNGDDDGTVVTQVLGFLTGGSDDEDDSDGDEDDRRHGDDDDDANVEADYEDDDDDGGGVSPGRGLHGSRHDDPDAQFRAGLSDLSHITSGSTATTGGVSCCSGS
jgi:Ctr copper transporter family